LAHAQKCPVCLGSGTVQTDSFGHPIDSTTGTYAPLIRKTCHGCMGLGWVTVLEPLKIDPTPTFQKGASG